MTDAEALDRVHRLIAGCVIKKSDLHDPAGNVIHSDSQVVGYDNANTIIRLLHADGWGWVRTS